MNCDNSKIGAIYLTHVLIAAELKQKISPPSTSERPEMASKMMGKASSVIAIINMT